MQLPMFICLILCLLNISLAFAPIGLPQNQYDGPNKELISTGNFGNPVTSFISTAKEGLVAKQGNPLPVESPTSIETGRLNSTDLSSPSEPSKGLDSSVLEDVERLDNLSQSLVPNGSEKDENSTDGSKPNAMQTSTQLLLLSTIASENINSSSTNGTNTTVDSTTTSQHKNDDVVVPTVTEPTGPLPNTIIQQTIKWLQNDTYTLSILIPVAGGFVFASVVIVIVATCNCIRRRCYRKRLRRKVLPDNVKDMRDRAKLLAETSDDEF